MDTTMQSRWMTLQEVAENLQLSKDMIYRLAQNRRVPASKIGSRWRVSRERIDRWMEDRLSTRTHWTAAKTCESSRTDSMKERS